MTNHFLYFPKRFDDDQLDVIQVLHQGLSGDGARRIFVYEGRSVSVGEMREKVCQMQLRLRDAGVLPKHRVAVMLSNSIDHIAIIYALILSGAVWVPVNVRLRGAGLEYIFEHSRPELLVTEDEFEDAVAVLSRVRICQLTDWATPIRPNVAPELQCSRVTAYSDALCILYTSGTTGAPKGVVFTHRMLRIASEAAVMVADFRSGDRPFVWEPLCHVGGAQMLMVPFLVDAQLHVVKRFSASQFWKHWSSADATHLHYLGGVLDVLMQLQNAGSIRVAWGAGISAEAWGPIRKRFGCELRECYGMTECSSFATLNSSGTPGSIGTALPWFRIEILDESGLPVRSGEIGELVLSSEVEGVFLAEYLDNPEATENAIRCGKLHTGDLAREIGNGEYAFVGRRTDSMRVRGENVSAWEVERIFIEHPAIKAVATVGVAGSIGEQEILLYVQFEPAKSIPWLELVRWAQPRLASFQLPRYYISVDSFDLTPSERIRKHLLPRQVEGAWDRSMIAAAT